MESLESRCLLAAEVSWVSSSDQQELLLYAPDEFGNRVPDFSTAGYRSGTHDIPHVPTKMRVIADGPDGDDAPDIQHAIDVVAGLPLDSNGFRGAVLLQAGEYDLISSIAITASGIVLRGEYKGSPQDPTITTILNAAGSANHGASPFRPIWPDTTVTAQGYDAQRFDYQADFIELAGDMSLHDLGVTVNQSVFFKTADGDATSYQIVRIAQDGFRFKINRPLHADLSRGTFIGSAVSGHMGGLIRVNPRHSSQAYVWQPQRAGTFEIVDDHVPIAATSFRVAPDPEGHAPLQPGDSVHVVRPGSREWVEQLGLSYEGVQESSSVQGWTSFEASKYLDRTITRVEPISDSPNYRVTIDAPITLVISRQFGDAYLSRYEWQQRISNVGIEFLKGTGIQNPERMREQYGDGHNLLQENHAWNFIAVEKAKDVWVRQVESEFFANAAVFIDSNATAVTVENVTSLRPISNVAGNRRYAFESLGQKVVFRDVYAEYARHSFVTTGSKSDLNVFVDATARFSMSESGPHLQLNTAGLFDNVREDKAIATRRVDNGEHGVRGASHVIWNSEIDYRDTLSPRLAINTDRGNYTLIPTDDSYTTTSNRDPNGARDRLPVRSVSNFMSYLKFDLSPISDHAVIESIELRLMPLPQDNSVEGDFRHRLTLLPSWDEWTEEDLNVTKVPNLRSGTPVDKHGVVAPQGILLADWIHDPYRANVIRLDAYNSADEHNLEILRSQLVDNQLTLRIEPGEDASGLVFYHANERGVDQDQPSFMLSEEISPSGEVIVRNWLIGSRGAIDPTDRSSGGGTRSSHENPVELLIGGRPYESLYDAQVAARAAINQPYHDYEFREYWLGDTDGNQKGDAEDLVEVQDAWAAQFRRRRGFDSEPFLRPIPFSFNVADLTPGQQIVGATLSLGLVDHLGGSQDDSLILESIDQGKRTKIDVPFAHPELGWFRNPSVGDTQAVVLDLSRVPVGSHHMSWLDELSRGALNVAISSMTDVDWAVLNLKVATNYGFHRDLSGDVYYLGDARDNIVTISTVDGGLLVEEGDTSTIVPNVQRFHFNGNAGDDQLHGLDSQVPVIAVGGKGDDQLTGGSGPDALEGGAGDDSLAGFLGPDVYILDTGHVGSLGTDRISEFSATWAAGGDSIDVSNSDYSNFAFEMHQPQALNVGSGLPTATDYVELVVTSRSSRAEVAATPIRTDDSAERQAARPTGYPLPPTAPALLGETSKRKRAWHDTLTAADEFFSESTDFRSLLSSHRAALRR